MAISKVAAPKAKARLGVALRSAGDRSGIDQVVKTGTPAKVNPLARKEIRIPELDGIRGIAVLLVLALHGFAWPMQWETWHGFPRVIQLLTLPGGLGVNLFFVLSGFLITGILLDAAGEPHYFRNFYGRRALRILPLYYLTLLLIFVPYPSSGKFVLLGSLLYFQYDRNFWSAQCLRPPLVSIGGRALLSALALGLSVGTAPGWFEDVRAFMLKYWVFLSP